MNCESFDARLDALLEGRCTPAEWQAAEDHVESCERCRRLFDAMSGRAGDLDDAGHEALAVSVVAKTSGAGRACESARERLCDLVDGALEPFDRELVEGHLGRCAECSALAAVLTEQARVLQTFVALRPREGFLREVLAATSRKPIEPTAAEKITAWLARAAQRPRFSLEVAYVMTLLLLVVLGNPVDAFREATVRVQPGVSAVAGAVSKPLGDIRAAGAEKLSRVEQALAQKTAAPESEAGTGALDSGLQWIQSRILTPFWSLASQASAWAAQVLDDVRRVFAAPPTEPSRKPAR